jgi:formate dehydrogenase iron-sulfur subunit
VPGLLIDLTRCVGCGNCQRACCEANDLHPSQEQLGCLSAETYTFVQRYDLPNGTTRFVKRQCLQCLHPACVSACTVSALHQTVQGIVAVDAGKCIGCRYCQYACPFHVPKFQWNGAFGQVRKCQFCLQRLEQGQGPACADGCPSGALKYGKRIDLLKEAHARLEAQPESYVNHVYGETEVGGTSRLYISDVPFEQLGLPAMGADPAPRRAEAMMQRTPVVAVSVAAVATGIYSVLRLRPVKGQSIEVDVEEEQ